MRRMKVNRTKEELAKYHADRQREYYKKNKKKLSARKLELYYLKKQAENE